MLITLESPITLRLEVPAAFILKLIDEDWLLDALLSRKLQVTVPVLLPLTGSSTDVSYDTYIVAAPISKRYLRDSDGCHHPRCNRENQHDRK